MAEKTYTEQKNYADTNINTNGANSITGAKHNVMLTYLIEAQGGKSFDATRPYKLGQMVAVNDATFGWELWIAPADVAAAAWNSANFTRITKRSEKITASDTPYTGLEAGVNTYSHNLSHTDFIIQAFDSSGVMIPLDVQAKSTTKITINSAINYANAVILIQEIVIS